MPDAEGAASVLGRNCLVLVLGVVPAGPAPPVSPGQALSSPTQSSPSAQLLEALSKLWLKFPNLHRGRNSLPTLMLPSSVQKLKELNLRSLDGASHPGRQDPCHQAAHHHSNPQNGYPAIWVTIATGQFSLHLSLSLGLLPWFMRPNAKESPVLTGRHKQRVDP